MFEIFEGYLVLGRIYMLNFLRKLTLLHIFYLKPIQLSKFCSENPSRYQFFLLIPIKILKFLLQPIHVPIFTNFFKIVLTICTLFYKNIFIRTTGWDFGQIWGKIKNNLITACFFSADSCWLHEIWEFYDICIIQKARLSPATGKKDTLCSCMYFKY